MEESILNAICTVYIPVSNVDRSIEWYRDKLGLQWVGYCFQLASGPTIFLVQSKDRPNMNYRTDDWDGQDFEMYALTFKVVDIHAAHRQLKANGVKVDEVIFTNPGSGYNFKFYDWMATNLMSGVASLRDGLLRHQSQTHIRLR